MLKGHQLDLTMNYCVDLFPLIAAFFIDIADFAWGDEGECRLCDGKSHNPGKCWKEMLEMDRSQHSFCVGSGG